jgi:hypothetical protein
LAVGEEGHLGEDIGYGVDGDELAEDARVVIGEESCASVATGDELYQRAAYYDRCCDRRPKELLPPKMSERIERDHSSAIDNRANT